MWGSQLVAQRQGDQVDIEPFGDAVGKVAGFSLHAGVAARADERKQLERLCRYISRPAVSESGCRLAQWQR